MVNQSVINGSAATLTDRLARTTETLLAQVTEFARKQVDGSLDRADGPEAVLRFGIAPETIIWDVAADQLVMVVDGAVPLPPGSLIELSRPGSTGLAHATVKRVRLLAPSGVDGMRVRLDCEVESE